MDLAEAESGIWESEEILGFNVYLSEISFGFDRLANEGETAVFKLEGGTEDLFPEIMSRVSYCIADSGIGRFRHLVRFRAVRNDTRVPDLGRR